MVAPCRALLYSHAFYQPLYSRFSRALCQLRVCFLCSYSPPGRRLVLERLLWQRFDGRRIGPLLAWLSGSAEAPWSMAGVLDSAGCVSTSLQCQGLGRDVEPAPFLAWSLCLSEGCRCMWFHFVYRAPGASPELATCSMGRSLTTPWGGGTVSGCSSPPFINVWTAGGVSGLALMCP